MLVYFSLDIFYQTKVNKSLTACVFISREHFHIHNSLTFPCYGFFMETIAKLKLEKRGMQKLDTRAIFSKSLGEIILHYADIDWDEVLLVQHKLQAISDAEGGLGISPEKKTRLWKLDKEEFDFLIEKYQITDEKARNTKLKFDSIKPVSNGDSSPVPPLGVVAVEFGFVSHKAREVLSQVKAATEILNTVDRALSIKTSDIPADKQTKENFVRKTIYHKAKKLSFSKHKLDEGRMPKASIPSQAATHLASLMEGALRIHPSLAENEDVQEAILSLERAGLVIFSKAVLRLSDVEENFIQAAVDANNLFRNMLREHCVNKGVFNINDLPIKIVEGIEAIGNALEKNRVLDDVEYNSVGYSAVYYNDIKTIYKDGTETVLNNKYSKDFKENGILNKDKYRDILDHTKYKDFVTLGLLRAEQLKSFDQARVESATVKYMAQKYSSESAYEDNDRSR